jgi:glycosyltransferase involved in cell wall biosynthesis
LAAARPLDLELLDGIELPAVSARYEKLRLLVRIFGQPVASVDLANDPRQLGLRELRGMFASRFSAELWAELTLRGLEPAPDDEQTGAQPVSVVVCTRNRPESLAECLTALALQRHPDYEVIVVDNGSSDGRTREVAERFGARYVLESRPGLDWARNRGLDEVDTALVAYTDDDARPDPEWLGALCAGFVAQEVGGATGLVAPAELGTRAQALFEDTYGGMGKGLEPRIFSRRGQTRVFQPHFYGAGCNMAFRTEVLRELGGFDPALDTGTPTGGGGDLDAFQRMVESGRAIVYRPDAIVRHTHRRTLGELRRQIYDNGRGYCGAFCAAYGRAGGRDRVRLAYRFWRWFLHWHVRRIASRLLRREQLPMTLLLAELRGLLAGPVYYRISRRRARRLARLGA